MTVAERNANKRERLTNELLKVKTEGLRVFINTPDVHNYFNYGLITDGKNIIGVNFAEYGSGFTTTFDYVPTKNCGSGCATLESGYQYTELSKEVFEEAVKDGKRFAMKLGAIFYRDIDHFFNDAWHKKAYVEL